MSANFFYNKFKAAITEEKYMPLYYGNTSKFTTAITEEINQLLQQLFQYNELCHPCFPDSDQTHSILQTLIALNLIFQLSYPAFFSL